ncbi:MAG: GNAT family N-acetyltransferase [Turicibacter sp.]|nr:GNAT family N-acetyltransferase [Turicibacter sp.]
MNDRQIFEATDEEAATIKSKLVAFNDSKMPLIQALTPQVINRSIKEGDAVVAGILATMDRWGILYIDILWVKETCRGKGYGSLLVNAVEKEAREKGAKLSRVETLEFQAKEFYEKLGYQVFGVLEDCPEGYKDYALSKRLV